MFLSTAITGLRAFLTLFPPGPAAYLSGRRGREFGWAAVAIGGRRGDERDLPAAGLDLRPGPFGPAAGLPGTSSGEV